MQRHTLGAWTVMAGNKLPISFLLDKSGALFGVFIGIGVDSKGLVDGDHQIDTLSVDQESFFTDFENWLIDVAGRYTILVSTRGETRVYTDPVGMNGMVYDPLSMQIASSTLLCLNRPIRDHPSYDHSVVERGDGKYTLFHTRDAKVRRCNPNCYINLDNFSEHRFWPKHETFETTDSNLAIYENLTSATRHVIRHINAKYKTVLPMSGGQDSRLLAVMAGTEIHKFDQIFSHIHNYASRIDATIAAEIAKVLQLDIDVSDRRTTKFSKSEARQEQAEFQVAAGLVTPQNREVELGLHRKVLKDAVVMRGHQVDLLRAVFIDQLGPKSRKNLKWQIKRLLIVPPREFSDGLYYRFLPEYEAWLETLPITARERSVDFMFLEIYYSSTLGVTFPALTHNFFMSPFNSRRLIALALSLDEKYRRKSHAVNDMVLMGNPALHNIPFDYEFGGARDLDRILDGSEMDEITAERRKNSHARIADLRSKASMSAT